MPKSRRVGSLTLDAVVDEAVGIVRAQGVAGLTMRAVASGLGVTPMAIYYYIADKEDLVRLVVGRVSESFGLLRAEPGRSWQQTLHDYMVNIWQTFRSYPGLSSYFMEQPALGVTPERLESGIAFFEAAGFPPAEARLAWSFVTTYVHGRISVDTHLGRGDDAPQAIDLRTVALQPDGLHAESLHADGLKAGDFVEFGVRVAVAGLESVLQSVLESGIESSGAWRPGDTTTPPSGRPGAQYDDRGTRRDGDFSLAGRKKD
jgi:AcrR family transcriptional regulator